MRSRLLAAACAGAVFAGCTSHGGPAMVPTGSQDNLRAASGARMAAGELGPRTFKFSGHPETYVVPGGVSSVTITAYGGSAGASGGLVQATFSVTGGEKLIVTVGGAGLKGEKKGGGAGGYNGGSSGGSSKCCGTTPDTRGFGGQGGGGATTVQRAGDGSYLIAAGGAGGQSGGGGNAGRGGGETGESAASSADGHGGTGGTQTCAQHFVAGSRGGGDSIWGGGGAGGGYCPGSGGSASNADGSGDSGGGGGSGYVASGASAVTMTQGGGGTSDGNGLATIEPPSQTSDVLTGLNEPWGVTVDDAGNVFVSDTDNNRVLKLAASGGGAKPVGAGFKRPEGLATDASGNLYVADFGNDALKKVTPDNVVSVVASGFGYESVTINKAGVIYATGRRKSENPFGRATYYWELEYIKDGNEGWITWDYDGGNTPHEVSTPFDCVDNGTDQCPIYVQMEVGKSGNQIWRYIFDGSHTVVSTPGITPDAGVFANGDYLYVASLSSHSVHQILNNQSTAIGGFFQGPQDVATSRLCTLCTVYVVNEALGKLQAIVP